MCQSVRCVKNCFFLLNHKCNPLKNWRFSSKFFSLLFLFRLLFPQIVHCLDGIFFCIFHIACNPADPFHFHADVINHLTAWALDRCDLLQFFIHTFLPVSSFMSLMHILRGNDYCILYFALFPASNYLKAIPGYDKKERKKNGCNEDFFNETSKVYSRRYFGKSFFFMQTSIRSFIHLFPLWILRASFSPSSLNGYQFFQTTIIFNGKRCWDWFKKHRITSELNRSNTTTTTPPPMAQQKLTFHILILNNGKWQRINESIQLSLNFLFVTW